MKTQSVDTHPRVERFQISLIRHASIAKRIARTRSLSQSIIRLSRRAILRANPELTENELNSTFIAYHYGSYLADRLIDSGVIMKNPDLLSAIKPVVEAFEKLGVHYYISGSLASSAYGIARATLDVDMVSNLRADQVSFLVTMLEAAYYIEEEMILDAISKRSSFNIIHLETMLKLDIFILKDDAYHRESFHRRQKDALDEEEESIQFYLVSPEDIILNKLDWYRLGGCVSERQWNDVLGVLKVQDNSLDIYYMRRWASELELANLLERALCDAGIKL